MNYINKAKNSDMRFLTSKEIRFHKIEHTAKYVPAKLEAVSLSYENGFFRFKIKKYYGSI